MTCKILTREEFMASATFPMELCRVTNPTWGEDHRKHIVKWIEKHCGAAWVYFNGKDGYLFGSSGDHIMFEIWLRSDPFQGNWQENTEDDG